MGELRVAEEQRQARAAGSPERLLRCGMEDRPDGGATRPDHHDCDPDPYRYRAKLPACTGTGTKRSKELTSQFDSLLQTQKPACASLLSLFEATPIRLVLPTFEAPLA